MDTRLREALDHYEITKVLNEYVHGCDRLDPVRMASVYAQSSWEDHGANKCSGPEFVRRVIEELPKSLVCSHLMGQTLIKVEGDSAGAESFFIVVMRTPTAEGGVMHNELGGRYVDRLIREDGFWKIEERICIRDWSISRPVESDWLEGGAHVKGRRDNSDPSFAALGLTHSAADLV